MAVAEAWAERVPCRGLPLRRGKHSALPHRCKQPNNNNRVIMYAKHPVSAHPVRGIWGLILEVCRRTTEMASGGTMAQNSIRFSELYKSNSVWAIWLFTFTLDPPPPPVHNNMASYSYM